MLPEVHSRPLGAICTQMDNGVFDKVTLTQDANNICLSWVVVLGSDDVIVHPAEGTEQSHLKGRRGHGFSVADISLVPSLPCRHHLTK